MKFPYEERLDVDRKMRGLSREVFESLWCLMDRGLYEAEIKRLEAQKAELQKRLAEQDEDESAVPV